MQFLNSGSVAQCLYLLAIFAAYAATATPACAQAEGDSRVSLAASIGADYSTGDYGAEEKTNVVLVPVILRARIGNLAISSSITYIRMEGPADVVIGPDGQQLPGVPTTGGIREGLSDLSLGVSYTFRGEEPVGPQLTLSGRVKLPTSEESAQLSTGKVDYSVRGEVSAPIGAVTPFASVGYRFSAILRELISGTA